MRALLLGVAFAVAAVQSMGGAQAQVYPARPITVVVPFTAGGPTDALMRVLGEHMRTTLGQALVVENVTGAAGTIGVARVARAAPDGYTLSVGHWSTHVVNGAVYALPFDLLKDLEPVALLTSYPMLLVSKNAVPASNLDEFLAWLRANQDKVSVGSIGVGSAAHVAGVHFQNLTGLQLQYVPYRGAAPALQDLMAGQIDFLFDHLAHSLAARARGKDQGLCGHGREPVAFGTRYPDIRRGRRARAPRLHLVWAMGSQGHAEGYRRQAQCRRQERAGRSGCTPAALRPRPGDPATRAADPGGARRPSQGGDREVVADRPGGQHQGAVRRTALALS